MTEITDAAAQADPRMTATEVLANAGSPQALAAAGQSFTGSPAAPALASIREMNAAITGGIAGQNTLTADSVGPGIGITSAAAASIAGHAGDTVGGAAAHPSEQAINDAWREQLIDDVVTRIQQAALAAMPAVSAPPPTPKPSPSRSVIFRDGTGNEYPAVVTRVYETGAVGLFVFRDDAPGTHSFGAQMQIDPTTEGAIGWFWPPRT